MYKLLLVSLSLAIATVTSTVSYSQVESSFLREVYTVKSTTGQFSQVRFGADGVPRLAASWIRDLSFGGRRTFVYDFPSMSPIDTFENMAVTPVFTRDGRYLVMRILAGGSEDIQLWEYGESNPSVRRLSLGQNPSLFAMTTSIDDRYLYIGCAAGVRVADLRQDPFVVVDTLEHWQVRAADSLKFRSVAHDVAVGHSGDRILSVDGSPEAVNGIKMWDASSHELLWEISPDIDTLGVGWVRWSLDDSKLKLLTIASGPWGITPRIEERSSSDGRVLHYLELQPSQYPYGAWYMNDGEYVAVQCRDSTIRVWRAETFELVEELHVSVSTMDVSPDGRYIATANTDSTLQVFEFVPSSVSEPVAGESGVHLLAPRPNPAHDMVEVPFQLVRPGEVELVLTDLQGRTVKIVATRFFEPGYHAERVETNDLSSGMYYVVLKVGGERHAKPVQVVR